MVLLDVSEHAENTEAADLQRKLEYLNSIVDQEQRAEQARRQMQYFGHSGYSEDSDYTSDVNYPVGHHANSSASQFRNTAHQMSTPQRSLETSRENSYETDEPPGHPPPMQHGQHLAPGPQHHPRRRMPRTEDFYSSYAGDNTRGYIDHDGDPLSYNSRPKGYKEPSRRRKHTWNYEDSQTSWYDDGYMETNYDTGHARQYPAQQYDTPVAHKSSRQMKGSTNTRRPSLERQTTLYDDPYASYEEKYYDAHSYPQTESTGFNQGQNYEQDYYNTSNYGYQDDRYGQEEEDRQWDSGGGGQDYYQGSYYPRERYENKINRSRTKSMSSRELARNFSGSVEDEVYYSTQQSYEDENYQVRNDYSGTAARRKQFNQSRSQSMSHNDDYDPDFPPRPKSNKPKLLPQIPIRIKPSPSLPPTPAKTQQHQATRRTGSLEYQEPQEEPNYYQEAHNKQNVYNEDYNYAYQSTDNLLPAQTDTMVSSHGYKDTINNVRTGVISQQEQVYQEQAPYYYEEKAPTVKIQRPEDDDIQPLSRRDTIKKQFQGVRRLESPRMLTQNTDSLESKDDDLRDSFETAMSSVSAQGNQSFNNEFTSVPEHSITTDKIDRFNNISVQDDEYNNSYTVDNKLDKFNNVSVQEKNRGAFVQDSDRYSNNVAPEKNDRFGTGLTQDKNDRYSSNGHFTEKASQDRFSTGPGVVGPTVPERNTSRNNSLQLREPILSQKTSPVATPTSTYPSQNHNQRFLQRQPESIDSYVDEEVINEADYSRESPASVVDRYPQDTMNTLIEPYHPVTAKPSSPSPPKRQETLDEEYDQFINESFDQPPEVFPIDEIPPTEEPTMLYQEPDIVTGDQPKRCRTAKERWHWAYNKIIHQLNVS